jgi:2-phosphosulfolactate phosphatase
LRLSLHPTPATVSPPVDLAVVIDVLRWTTTATTALARGAVAVEACASAEEARTRAAAIGALTAGERGGHRIPGFDLGNSPLECTAERVAGRVLCATTTNGTRALIAAAGAPRRFLAAFVNLHATAAAIRALAPAHVALVCAGTDGAPSDEDTACAEALRLALRDEPVDAALLARAAASPHAAFLCSAGFDADVQFALTMDSVPVVAAVDAAHRVTAVTRGPSVAVEY